MLKQKSFHLPPRDRAEEHRAATPLELMFDLASVIAIAAAAAGLHHAVAHSHFAEGVMGFFFSFFMIWLAWMNYTWSASAFDNGSRWFQIMSMVIMFGSLVLAAGTPAVFAGEALYLALVGFVIMRLGLVALWLSAAFGNVDHRSMSLRYAAGIGMMQIYWILIILLLPAASTAITWAFLIGFAGELAIPAFAERDIRTPWHRHHIVERYGLMNIIVLGECFLAVVMAINSDGDWPSLQMLQIGILAAVITFLMWALYFNGDEHLGRDELSHVMMWAYGHFAVFGAVAAAGAGFAVMIDYADNHADLSETAASLSVAIPVAIYVLSVWVVRDRYWLKGIAQFLMPTCAILVLLAGAFFSEHSLILIAIVLIGALILRPTLRQQK
ncbi:low temperature requirement protein A [Phaeobacter gallaeciensis]|uniref:Low temperature requirement protein A n=1 Tax=Phaeobacter gallaeciensis TaxID=60890 RepID=A0A366WP10_9RHOB|nr:MULTISPECIES: low temperature requirement protein A [Roseobacteraceae]MBT8166794.1 low temperature requirement protein A [Falsiruegeria litorea]RBW51640.1 low temperature requirement protein A [Phaeobacter gallaeciensis]